MVTSGVSIVARLCFMCLWLCVTPWALTACPPEFEGLCTCGFVPSSVNGKTKLTYVTNCTNTGFDNTMMLRKLPDLTEVVIFTGNEIKDLPLNIFGQETTYDRLRTIDFSNNRIQTIKGRTFHNVANVTKLILNDNDLYIISKDHHPRMFSNFANLRELHLRNAFTEKVRAGDYLNNLAEMFESSSLKQLRVLNMENNEISGVYHGEFCTLPSLEELYLADNHLRDIPLNFSCLQNLKLLDVGNNYIQYLSESTLQSLQMTKHLKLNFTSNPFECDCNLVTTYEWISSTRLTLINRDHYYCNDGFPVNVGKSLFSVVLNDLQCFPTVIEYHVSAAFILFSIGLSCVVVVLAILIYKNRLQVGAYVRRTIHPICTKFHYSSLDRRENSMDV